MQATLRGVARGFSCTWLAALSASFAPPAVASVWVLRGDTCREEWSGADLVRGPNAILSGALRPVRSLAGGFVYAGSSVLQKPSAAATAPLWIVGSTLFGVAQGLWWIGTGALDTVTGGAFMLAPAAATGLRLDPTVPFVEDDGPVDHCHEPPAQPSDRAQASPVAIGTSSASPHSAQEPS